MPAATTASTSPALAVACPVCAEQPGKPCRDSLGRPMEVHLNRHFAWVRAIADHLSPDVAPPPGASFVDDWQRDEWQRVVMGPDRCITDSDMIVRTSAIQRVDGRIDSDDEYLREVD